jgi:membrane protein
MQPNPASNGHGSYPSSWHLAVSALLVACFRLLRPDTERPQLARSTAGAGAASELNSISTTDGISKFPTHSRNKSWWDLVRDAGEQWIAHKDARLGAALSYYSVFSIGPLILIAVAIAGLLFGQDAVRGEVSNSLKSLLGDRGAEAINGILASASKPQDGIFASVVGVGALVFAAIGVVVQLKDAMNTVWDVEEPPGKGVWGFVRSYVLSFAGVLALGFLLMVSMLATTALAAAGKFFAPYLPEAAFQLVGFIVSFLVISLLFAMMFKWLPDADVTWGDVWLGAVVTALMFEVGKTLIGLYIGKQGLESTYGAAASIVVVLIWVYYSAQILFLGAEFTNVYAKNRGSLRQP